MNQIKEQGQVTPGALDDLTVSVAINGEGFGSLRESQLLALVGNAAGIAASDQRDKIAIVSAPFSDSTEDEGGQEGNAFTRILETIPLWVFIAGAVLLAVLIGLVILLIARKRKKEAEEEEELLNTEGPAILAVDGEEEEVPEFNLNEELQEIKNDRGMALKKSIREFAEQNPEISAQLIKNWLNGGSGDGTN